MWKLAYRLYALVAATQRLVERRFTQAGLIVLAALVVSAAIGVDTRQTQAYQIFALAAALAGVAWLGARLQRNRFSGRRSMPRVVTAGEPFSYRIALSNLSSRPLDGIALLEDLDDAGPSFADFRRHQPVPTYRGWQRLVAARRICQVEAARAIEIPARATVEIVMRGLALRRGSQHFAGFTVARADPLGLARGLTRLAAPANLLVLPRRYVLPAMDLPGSRQYQPGGVSQAVGLGNSEEFIGLRHYRPGDPLQRLHWKSFARTGKPVVREYQDEFFERHALVLDTFATATPDTEAFEAAVSIAASFVQTIDTSECLLDLVFVGDQAYCYTTGRGQLSAGSLLEILSGVRPAGNRPFRQLHGAVLGRRGALTGVIAILLAWDGERGDFIRALRRLGVPVKVLVVSAQPVGETAPWLHAIVPGRVQEGLARL